MAGTGRPRPSHGSWAHFGCCTASLEELVQLQYLSWAGWQRRWQDLCGRHGLKCVGEKVSLARRSTAQELARARDFRCTPQGVNQII